jgi:DNA-binding transcriptional LysR family regulator
MGHAVLPHAEAMESAVLAAQGQLSGTEVAIRGVVRLGVPEALGVRFITPLLAQFLQDYPELSVDLLVQPRFANLASREADLGVTLDAPNTGRYMVTRLASFRLYVYGSPAYLARHAPILKRGDLAGHDFVDYIQDRLASNELNFLDELGVNPRRRLCCTGMLAQAEAAAAGLGLMMAPPYMATDGRLVPVLQDEVFVERAYWLVAPVDLYRLPRVRAVWNVLRQFAESHAGLFMTNK